MILNSKDSEPSLVFCFEHRFMKHRFFARASVAKSHRMSSHRMTQNVVHFSHPCVNQHKQYRFVTLFFLSLFYRSQLPAFGRMHLTFQNYNAAVVVFVFLFYFIIFFFSHCKCASLIHLQSRADSFILILII